MVNGTARDRNYICRLPEVGFFYYALYYFHEYFSYRLAPFHYDMIDDLEALLAGKYDFLLWVMFREAAKTVWSRIFISYCIVFNLKRYINWDAYDKSNAEAALFDITVTLQSNELLIADYGHLYHEKRTGNVKIMKRIAEFITSNGIKVEAFSTQQSTRGRIYKKFRPDLFVLDDFETAKTKNSMPVIQKIREHINEMLAGLGPDGDVIFNCNLITEAGVVQHLIGAAEKDPRFLYRRVDAEQDGEPAWPEKYTMTDAEAAVTPPDPGYGPKVSLEGKRRTLNAGGEKVYEMEMLNSPEAAGDLFFDRAKIDYLLEKAVKNKPIKSVAGRYLWQRYDPSHKYAIGADTSKGVGLDANASCGVDFGPTAGVSGLPAVQVLSYANNEIPPDTFAHELKAEGEDLGECLIAPEINAESGGTCLNELRHIYPEDRIFRRGDSEKPKMGSKPSMKLGWETTSLTKPQMMFGLKKAIEDGLLTVMDPRILKEARAYTQADLSDTSGIGQTRHFDLLKSLAICWAMKISPQLEAEVDSLAQKNQAFVQPKYSLPTDFAGGQVDERNINLGSEGMVDPFTGRRV